MKGSTPLLLAIDGHDGSGKTTLAKRLAHELHASYARPFGEPYGGRLMEAAEKKDYASIIGIGDQAVMECLRNASSYEVVVFDRMWVTLLSLLPPSLHARWQFRPPTLVCWADLPTTLGRLSYRSEEQVAQKEHEKYLDAYLGLSNLPNCELVLTSVLDEQQVLAVAVRWAALKIASAHKQ